MLKGESISAWERSYIPAVRDASPSSRRVCPERQMSNLLALQRRVAAAVMQPLTSQDRMRRKTGEGLSLRAEAEALIRPNRVLSSLERLDIYNRQYWFRVLSCLAEDFQGLRSIVGPRKFERLMRAHLADCPSVSFTLRNLGSRLEVWLRSNTEWIAPRETLALDMVRLEWAHVETFDGGYEPILTPADIESAELRIALQPYIRLRNLLTRSMICSLKYTTIRLPGTRPATRHVHVSFEAVSAITRSRILSGFISPSTGRTTPYITNVYRPSHFGC